MNGTLQLIGFIITTIASIGNFLTTILPDWRKNDPGDEIIDSVVRHQGIWLRCISYSTGQWQCDDYDAIVLGLQQSLQVARGLTVSACILSICGFVILLVGMECTGIMRDQPVLKGRVSMCGGICTLLAAIGIGAAVSYYAHQVLYEYNIQKYNMAAMGGNTGNIYIYGSCLFIGWVSMGFGVIGSVIVFCGSYGNSEEDDGYRAHAYRPANKPGRSTEYV